jgi:hypothetical protein
VTDPGDSHVGPQRARGKPSSWTSGELSRVSRVVERIAAGVNAIENRSGAAEERDRNIERRLGALEQEKLAARLTFLEAQQRTLKDAQADAEDRESRTTKRVTGKAVASGGALGAVVVAVVELVKMLLGGG